MSQALQTLRNISGLGETYAGLKQSALIMIDCQNTYRRGIMQLVNVEQAITEAQRLLYRARALNIPIFHIQHDAGVGSPYDITAEIGAIAPEVKPMQGERVIVKHFPNAFVATDLEIQLKSLGIENLILAGFMTHMCVNSTARSAFNLGFSPTVIASACATRSVPGLNGTIIQAEHMHASALAALSDLFAVVVDEVEHLHD